MSLNRTSFHGWQFAVAATGLALAAAAVCALPALGSANAHRPHSSPSVHNGEIAFTADTELLYAVSPLTGRIRRLWPKRNFPLQRGKGTRFPVASLADPAWSPNGRHLAFAAGRNLDHRGIWIMNSDGSGLLSVLDGSPDAAEEICCPVWSPNGRAIAYFYQGDGFVFDLGTWESSKVTSSWIAIEAWSSRNTIAYVSAGGSIVLSSPTGRHRRRLVGGHSPDFSPDGSELLFQRGTGVFRIGVDGHHLRRVLDVGRDKYGPEEAAPEWSPDGRKLAYWHDSRIWVANIDGSHPRQVPHAPSDPVPAADFDWRPLH